MLQLLFATDRSSFSFSTPFSLLYHKKYSKISFSQRQKKGTKGLFSRHDNHKVKNISKCEFLSQGKCELFVDKEETSIFVEIRPLK